LSRSPARGAPAGSEARQTSEKAIAVLPFRNLSNDPEQEFFSDGIAEDILNELAKGAELIVRPRSSSFSFKGESKDIPTIGERLHVTHVLDGTVRRAGQRVRVTVQLSEVETNRSIWTERYDRDMTDIFDVQDEITGEVLNALKAQLSGTRTPRKFVGTEAYNAFLRGRHHLAQGEPKLAQEWYENAIQLDPQNTDALAGLGRLLDMRGQNRGQSLPEHRIQMAVHFDRVLAVDPGHPQALAWKAENTFFRNRDYQSAINQLVAVANANPSHEEAHRSLTWVLWAIGREELYLSTTRRMVEIAPLSREVMLNEINANLNTGRLAAARHATNELSRLQIREDPNSMAWLAILDHDPDALQAVINRSAVEAWYFPFVRAWNSAMVPYLKGDFEQAQELIAARKSGNREPTTLERHMIALIERDFDAAFEHYAAGLEDGFWFAFVRAQLNYPYRQTFPEFYEDPRFDQLLQKYKLDPVSAAALKVPELNFSAR
jgi:TolB-like protein/Flp pilus assembly protein TadD